MPLARKPELALTLARSPAEIDAAQALRFEVFYDEMGAHADNEQLRTRRDRDRFDEVADHILVIDRSRGSGRIPAVVGCYRVLRRTVAARHGGFYTAGEFDLTVLSWRDDEIMELGRACVHRDYRSGAVMQLLWRGIAHYVEQFEIGILLGCASLPGADPDRLRPALTYLHERHLAPIELRPRALPERFVPMVSEPPCSVGAVRRAGHELPALLRAYLRAGGMVGDGAVLDSQFNTTDVCMVLPTDRIRQRYRRHYLRGDKVDESVAV